MIILVSLYFIVYSPPLFFFRLFQMTNKLCVPVGDVCDAFIYVHHTGSCF